jgi:chemotaxis protein CheX
MDQMWISEAVIDTTRQVLSSMASMNVLGGSTLAAIIIPERHLTAMVGFAGSYMGLTAIHCSETVGKKICGSMLRMPPETLSDEDVRDAMGEIANIIAGRFKTAFIEKIQAGEEVFDQSVPSVICGDDYETHTVTDAPTTCVEFTSEQGVFFVELSLKKM